MCALGDRRGLADELFLTGESTPPTSRVRTAGYWRAQRKRSMTRNRLFAALYC